MSNNRKRMRRKARKVKGVNFFSALHKNLMAFRKGVLKTRDKFIISICMANAEIEKVFAKIKAFDESSRRVRQ